MSSNSTEIKIGQCNLIFSSNPVIEDDLIRFESRCEVSSAWAVAEPVCQIGDIENWYVELDRLYNNLEGKVSFNALEQDFRIVMTGNKLGQIEMIVDISSDPITQSHQFRFELDQSYLPPLINQLKAVSRRCSELRIESGQSGLSL